MSKKLVIIIITLLLVGCGGQAPATDDDPYTDRLQSSTEDGDASTDASANEVEEATQEASEPVTLRVAVSLNAEARADFERGLAAIQTEHANWKIKLESLPHQGGVEPIATQITSGTLPDVLLVDGSSVQQWIRQGAFSNLNGFIVESEVDLGDFFPGTIDQFAYDNKQWGIPNDAVPEVVYYNKEMFDAAGLAYPTDDWSYEQMREAAKKLTLDGEGRNATDPDFDAENIVQWGWNRTPQHIWARHYIRIWGTDHCTNADCTLMDLTNPEVVAAYQWWADMAQEDHSVPVDLYTGEQTGVAGDAFLAGKAAMGFNNVAATTQLNEQSTIKYDIVQPFKGVNGNRYGRLSTQGYVIAATSEQQEAAWTLIQLLTSDPFLTEYVAKPGHSIPARRSAARFALNPDKEPANQQAILDAMEYEEVFRPFTSSAFEAYDKTNGLFIEAMKGDRPLEEVLAELEETANEVLSKDR